MHKHTCLCAHVLACTHVAGSYVVMARGTNACTGGSAPLTDAAECEAAAGLLGLNWAQYAAGVSSSAGVAKGCYQSGFGSQPGAYFNTHPSGAEFSGTAPICRSLSGLSAQVCGIHTRMHAHTTVCDTRKRAECCCLTALHSVPSTVPDSFAQYCGPCCAPCCTRCRTT